jgi:hypothetical protein
VGIATFVFKMQLYNDEELAISFKNLTVNAEFKYLLSDENLSASDTIVDKTNSAGANITNNLIIKNISDKKYLYISFRANSGQTSASVEDIQIEHSSSVTEYEDYVEDKIFILNDNDVYEEFKKQEEAIYIVESGSNENGSWTKYNNGIMKCHHTITGNQFACTQKAENGFYYTDINQAEENTKTWSFPAKFISAPMVEIAVASNAYSTSSLGYITNQYAVGYCVLPYAVANTQFTWNFIAIGRWK